MSVHLGKTFRALPHSLLRHIHSSLACHCDRPSVFISLISCSSRQPWPCNCSPLPMWSEKPGKSVVRVNAPEKAVFQSLSKPVSWGIYLPRVVSFDLFASTEPTDHHWMLLVKWFQQCQIVVEQKTYTPSPSWCKKYIIWSLTCPQDLLWIVQILPHQMIWTALLFRVIDLYALNWHTASSFFFKMKKWKSTEC